MHKELAQRLGKLEYLRRNISGIMIFNVSEHNNPNFLYLTNFDGYGVFYYDFKSPKILTAEMEAGRARLSWVPSVQRIVKFKDIAGIAGGGKIGIDKSNIDAATFEKISKKFRVIDISGHLENARGHQKGVPACL
jgi:hypothetical protein